MEGENLEEVPNETRTGGRQYCGPIKIKGRVDKEKRQGTERLFVVNCDGFGPDKGTQSLKVHQLSDETEKKKLDGILISSSDIRWNIRSRNRFETKLRAIASHVALNTSDSRQESHKGKSFLKGGTLTALWGDIRNCTIPSKFHEHEHGL